MCMYIHVHVVTYFYVHGINMYVPCSDTYVPFCPILSRWVGFQMVSLAPRYSHQNGNSLRYNRDFQGTTRSKSISPENDALSAK